MRIVYDKYDVQKWLQGQPLPLNTNLIYKLLPFPTGQKRLKYWLSKLVSEGLLIRAHYAIPTKVTGRTVLYGVGRQFDNLCERIRNDKKFLIHHCRKENV